MIKTIVNAFGKLGRKYLALRHRELRVWPGGGIGHQLHQGGARQAVGLGAASAELRRLLRLRAVGAGVEGQGADVRQCADSINGVKPMPMSARQPPLDVDLDAAVGLDAYEDRDVVEQRLGDRQSEQ